MQISSFLPVIYAYVLSFAFVTVLLVYVVNLPAHITGEPGLVNTFYGANFSYNLLFDLFFVSLYLAIAHYTIGYMGYQDLWKQLLVVSLVVVAVSGSFCLYFTSRPQTSNFFSKWFHTVGTKAVVYDVALVGSMFYVYQYLQPIFQTGKL